MDKKLTPVQKIALSISLLYLILFTLGSFSFAFYYPFAHIGQDPQFNFFYLFSQTLRFSAFFLIPLSLFFRYPKIRSISKLILPLIALFMVLSFKTFSYVSENMSSFPIENGNSLSSSQLEINHKINSFLPTVVIEIEYLLEAVLLLGSSILIAIEDRLKKEDFKSLLYYPIFFVLSIPLNTLDSLKPLVSSSIYNTLLFDNFNIFHVLLFIALFAITISLFLLFRKSTEEKKLFILRTLMLLMFLLFLSKDSMLIGDGYNVYNNVIAAIPLFICDIGKFIVLLALFTEKPIFYKITYFVHSAGALTVFFYLGKPESRNFGWIFSYSFLYFTITHLLLFVLSVLPIYWKLAEFKKKDILIPSLYYFGVIMVSMFVSVLITNWSNSLTDASGVITENVLKPNFAFTQICPLPVDFPTFLNFKIGICEVNFFYELILFIAYVVLFSTFYLFNCLLFFLIKKVKAKLVLR